MGTRLRAGKLPEKPLLANNVIRTIFYQLTRHNALYSDFGRVSLDNDKVVIRIVMLWCTALTVIRREAAVDYLPCGVGGI